MNDHPLSSVMPFRKCLTFLLLLALLPQGVCGFVQFISSFFWSRSNTVIVSDTSRAENTNAENVENPQLGNSTTVVSNEQTTTMNSKSSGVRINCFEVKNSTFSTIQPIIQSYISSSR